MGVHIAQCFIVLNFYAMVHGNSVVYYIDETDIPSTYIGTVSYDANLKELVGQNDFRNLKYTFLGSDNKILSLFKIDERTSRLETTGALGRETVCEFLTICALNMDVAVYSTRTSFFMKIPVTVYINDLNDNAKLFYEPNITISLSEGVLVGTTVTIDGARDRDTSNAFSIHSYELFPASSPFSIDIEKKLDGSSMVRLKVEKALDRETQSFYMLKIVAKDGGSPAKSGTLHVDITVTDVNDNAPVFSERTYEFIVKENIKINSVIGIVQATDLDSGKNGEVTYRLSSHQPDTILNLFTVNNTTGELKVMKSLSHAAYRQYQITVEAMDGADQPLFSQTSVTVVIDNRVPPVIG